MAHSKKNRREQHDVTRTGSTSVRGEGRAEAEAAEAPAAGANQAAEASARPTRRRWWEADSDRFEREVAELSQRGYQPRPAVRDGRMTIAAKARLFGQDRDLLIAYPDCFPYMRFEVFTSPLGVQKHQNPYAGNLCLLDQSTSAWSIDDTAASILSEQIPKLEQANAQTGPVPGVEVPQAEPISFYFEGHRTRFVVVPPPTRDLNGRVSGTLRVALACEGDELRGVVLSIDGRRTTHPRLDEVFSTDRELDVPWRWVDHVPPSTSPRELFQHLLSSGLTAEPNLRSGDVRLEALAFSEDVRYGAPPEVGWIFLVWKASGDGLEGQIARSERYDPEDQAARLPTLQIGRAHV